MPLYSRMTAETENHKLGAALTTKEAMLFWVAEFKKEYPDLAGEFFESLETTNAHLLSFLEGSPHVITNTSHHSSFIHAHQYRKFLRLLDVFAEKNKDKILNEQNFDRFKTNLNSTFLASYGSNHLKIRGSDLPSSIYRNFGFRLPKDLLAFQKPINLEIDELVDYAFDTMEAGDIRLDRFSFIGDVDFPTLCRGMVGGKVRAKEVVGSLAKDMIGGTIIACSLSKGFLGFNARGGTAFVKKYDLREVDPGLYGNEICSGAKKGTFFIENIVSDLPVSIRAKGDATILIKCRRRDIKNDDSSRNEYDANIIYYDEIKDVFVRINPKMDGILYAALSSSRSRMYKDLRFINDLAKIKYDFAQMTGGIFVIENTGEAKDIGKGMKGGIIIFDDPAITYEEACKRVAPITDRPGGVVLFLRKYQEVRPGAMWKFGITQKRAEFMEIK